MLTSFDGASALKQGQRSSCTIAFACTVLAIQVDQSARLFKRTTYGVQFYHSSEYAPYWLRSDAPRMAGDENILSIMTHSIRLYTLKINMNKTMIPGED